MLAKDSPYERKGFDVSTAIRFTMVAHQSMKVKTMKRMKMKAMKAKTYLKALVPAVTALARVTAICEVKMK
jgi:hypothetical protein